jgi:hypothetical protein
LYLLLLNLQSEEDDSLARDRFLRKISREDFILFNGYYESADILNTGGARLLKGSSRRNGMKEVGCGRMKRDG